MIIYIGHVKRVMVRQYHVKVIERRIIVVYVFQILNVVIQGVNVIQVKLLGQFQRVEMVVNGVGFVNIEPIKQRIVKY
jgi:hypothetical protein